MDHSFVDMAGTGRNNLLSYGEIENEHNISIGRKQKRHVHRGRKKLHRRRKSKKKLSTSTEILYSFPSLNDTYERLKKIDKLVNTTEITKSSDSLESSTSVYQTDNENSNDEFETLESSQILHKTMDGNSDEATNHQEGLDEGLRTSKSSTLHHQKNQENSDEGTGASESSILHHQTSRQHSKSSLNIFEMELEDIIENDKELDESFSMIEKTTILSSHLSDKSEETSATIDFTSPNMDYASSSEGFSLGDEKTFLPSEYQVDIIQQLATLTEYPPTKRIMLKDQAFKRSQDYPLDSKNEIIKNVINNKKPHPVHHAKVEYEKVDSTEPVSSFDNSDYENVQDEDYIDIQLPFEKPHRKYTKRFVEKREPFTESDKSDPNNKNQHLLSKMKFDRRFNRRRLFATSTAFWRGFKWPDFEESFDSIIRDSDELLQKDVTSTKPSTKADFLWSAIFTTSAAEGNTETENQALYEKMEPNDKNIIESSNFYSDTLESSTFEGSESREQIGSNFVNSAVSDMETLHSVTVKLPEMMGTSNFELPEFSENQLSEKKVAAKTKVEAETGVEDYSKQSKSFLSFSWPDHIQYTTSSPVEITSGAVKQENKSEESTTEGYTSNKLPTNTNEVLNQSSYKTINNSVTERPRTRMQKMKEKAKFWKNFIWPDHQTYNTPKTIESDSEAVNSTRINEQVVESEMQTTSQKVTTTEKKERPTKIIEGTNYSLQLSSRSYNTEKLEHEGLVSSAEKKKTEESTSPSANRENLKKLFHLKGKSNKTSETERKSFELPFQWPSDEVFENETSEKPISISGFEGGKNKTKISDESVSVLANFKWPDQKKFDYTSANMPMTEKITTELPNINKLFTTSSHTESKPGESTRNVWGQFQWPEHELFSYHHIDTEKQKGTRSPTSEKWASEGWGFSLDQDVKDILEETEEKTLLLHEGTPYPSKLTLSPTKSTTRGERIELVEDMANFKDLSGKLEDVITKGPMKVSAKHKPNAQVTESEDDEGLWKFRVLEPGEVIKHQKKTSKPFFESPTIYSFKPIGTLIDEWLQFNEDLQEITVTEPTVSKRTKSTFFIWKTEPITSTESTEFDEEIFEEYSTLTPLESASETTEFFNVESFSSEDYTIPEIMTTRKPTFSSEIYDYLGQTESTALKFNVSSFIRNFMKKFTVKIQNTAVQSERIEEEKLDSTQSIFENIVPSTIPEKVEEEKMGSTQIIIENIVQSTISEKVKEEKLGSTPIIIENIVPSTISERVEEEKLGSIHINIENIVRSTISEKVEEEKLGSTQIIIANIVPSTISERVEEEKLGSIQINIENIVPSTISVKVQEEKLGSTHSIFENIVPSKISEKVEEEKLGSIQINIENIVPSTMSEKVQEEKLGSTKIIIENIVPSTISEKVEDEELGSGQIIIENIVPSTISEEVEEEELSSTRTITENIVPSIYAFQEMEVHRGSPSSSEQTTVYKTSSTPMTPSETYSQISEEIRESAIAYETEEPEIEKPQEVLILDQIKKEIESEDVNVKRTSATWLFETNYPEYSRGQYNEYYMNDMKKSEEYEVNDEFLLQKIYQTTEESVFPAEAQSALVEDMRRSQKPVISIESELGTTVQYFQELKGFDNHFKPAESTKISYEEEFTKQPHEKVFKTKQVKQSSKFTLLEENGHIESEIVEEVTVGGEISTNEQKSEILEELLTEVNAELYSELPKLKENEFKNKWRYDLNLARSSKEGYPTELIRTPAVQENLQLKMIHLPDEASTSHGEQLGTELDHDILHITQKKTEDIRKEDMQIKEEYDNNMNHIPENLLQETSTICQICDEQSSYEADLQIGEISKTPKLTSRRYKLIPVNYNQKGTEINRPVPTKKGNIFIFNQKPKTTSQSSTFTELKVQSLREQGTTENVQEVATEKINAEADKTEITSLKEYLTSSSTVTEEVSELIGEKNYTFLTKQWKDSKLLDILKSETNTESVSIENIPVNKEEHVTFPTENYSTEKTDYQVDIENTKVENTLSTTEYFKQDMVGENLSTYPEDVFGLVTISVGEEKLLKTQMTSTSLLLENIAAFEQSLGPQSETSGKKTTNYELTLPNGSKDNVQTMQEGFHSTKLNENQFSTMNLNDFEHSLTPKIDIMSKSRTTEMIGKEKDELRTKKITLVQNVHTTMMPRFTEKKEEYENNMLHLPANKQEGTSTLCEICDSQEEYVVGKYLSTSNPKAHKTPKTYRTTNIKFKVDEITPGSYHFEGIKINRPLPTESHTILPFKMNSTSYSEQQESNTASKGGYHSQSSITKARTGSSYIETTLNVSQEISTTTEDNTAAEKSHSKEVNTQELITTSERNMFSMKTLSHETVQKLIETANENTTPVETFSSVKVPQKYITTAEENIIPLGTFAPAEENATSLETFPHGNKSQELVTAPEEIFSETFSIEKVLSEFFTPPEKSTATFINENTLEEFVTMVPISSLETFASEESLQEFITKAEESAVSIEIFSVEKKLQESITKRVENTSSFETFSREKIPQELVTTPEKTTGSFPSEYRLKELVNTTDINTVSVNRISSEKNAQELITSKMENTALIEVLPQEKNAQESMTTKENTVFSVNEYNLEEFINATEINTASVETASSETNTQQFISTEKEKTASIEIFPHGKSPQETITKRRENTTSLGTYSKETISEAFFTTPEKNSASIVDEYNNKEFVITTEMNTASFSSEKNTQEFLTIEHENISTVEIFPYEHNLQEWITTKEKNTASSEIFSKGQVSQELSHTPEGNTASIKNNYSPKELVNTAEIYTAAMMSTSNEKITPELLTIEFENIASVEIFPHEKNLQEWITTKEENTASSKTFSKGQVSQELIYTPEENTASIMNKSNLKELFNTAEIHTASWMSISSEKNTEELITPENERISSIEIFPHENHLLELITSTGVNTAYSEILSKEKFSQELINTAKENTEFIVDQYSLEKLVNTADMNNASSESISSEKSTQEVINKEKKNTVSIETSPHEISVPELITSKEGNTASLETFSGEKLLQEFITTLKINTTSFVNEYSLKDIVNTADMKTAPRESISREKITEEFITIEKENTTPTGIFPHEKNLLELITSKEGSTVSSETFSGEKLLQELFSTPEKTNISFVNEYSLKEFLNTAEMNTASMGSVSREKDIQELITIEKGKTASIEVLPHEKNIHELITSKERSTVFSENLSNWKILQESSTTSNRNITTFVEKYRPQDFITTAEMKTASRETLPSEKNYQGLFTTTKVNISAVEELLVENITQKFNITPHGSTVAMETFSNGKELDEFIITTERVTGFTEKLSKQNAPEEITTSANGITASIEPVSNEIITAARMPNEETLQKFNASSRINTAFTEETFNEKTNTETMRKELYDTEPVRQSENTMIFEAVTERTFASSTPKKITEKNLNTNTKNLNLVNNEHIGSEISTKNLHETEMFITSLSKRSTTENIGKTSLKSNLAEKEWQHEMEDEFEMLHLPHVDRYETSTICEICSESEDVQISTIQVSQSKERSSENFQSIPETVSVRTNKDEFGKIMSTKQIEREEEYASNMLNLPRNEQAETSTLCEICDEDTQYERVGHISSKKADFEELATSIFGTPEINKASIFPYSFTGIEINRPIPTQNFNIVPFKMYSSTIPELSNANTPKINYITASTEALSKEAGTPLSITEELYETEHEVPSEKPANTIQEDINIKPVIFSTLNEWNKEEVVTKLHSKKKLGTITDEYIGSFVTENLHTDTDLSMDTSVEKESNDDYEMLHLPRMNKHETSTICEICLEVEDIQTPKPQLFTPEKLSNPKSYLSTEAVSEHIDEEKESTENFDYVEESNMLKLPEIRKDETSTLCEICDEETGSYGSTIRSVLFENLVTSKPKFMTAEQEAITSTDDVGKIIINRPIPTQNMNIMPFNVHSTMYNVFTKSEEEFLFQNFLTSSTETSSLIELLGNVTSESVSEILQETEIIDQSKEPYPGIALLSPGVLDELESSVISQSTSPNEFASQFEVMEINSDLNLYTQASPEELKDEFTEDLSTEVLDETEFSRLSLQTSLKEFSTQFEVAGKAETIFENAESVQVTLESVDEILQADESVHNSKQPYNEITILPPDLMEDLNVYTQASSEELKDEATEDLLSKDLDETEFPGISLPSSLNEFTTQFDVEGEAETIYQNAKLEEVTLGGVREILHADETVDHSKQSYNGMTILPTDLMEDLNVHTEASSEELKEESTEDLLTKVLDETEFSGISVPSSLEEFTSQFDVGEAEKMFKNAKPEDLTSKSVDEIFDESEIVKPSKLYSGITFLPSDSMEIGADSNLYTQVSSEEVKTGFTEDLLTKVLDETEFPQITLSPSLEEVVGQLQTEEAEKMLRSTSKDQFPSEPLQHLQLDQYETTTIPHYDHILKTLPFSTTKEVLETSTQSAVITTSHKLDEHEYRDKVHLSLNTEYKKTESLSTSKQDTQEALLISSTIHTKKPGIRRPITYKFEGIKINRPVPTENTNIIVFKMLPATEPRLCKVGEEEFPHEKYISSTHKSTLHAESSSVESRASEIEESHEIGKISGTGTSYETQKEILSITEQTSDNFSTNFPLVNVEHGMKEQSSTLYFFKDSEDMTGVRENIIPDHESSILEITSEPASLKDEEAMAEREKEISEKSETYVHLPLKSDETASMLSSLLEHHTSEMIKHVSIEETFEEGFRETQEAYTHPFMSEGVELDKDMTNYNVLSSEIGAQSTLGVSETIENEIENQYSKENFPGSTLPPEEKETEVVSSRKQLLIPNKLNKKLESLDSVVSELFTPTFSPVQNVITVEREFQTINMETDILENELKELNVDFSEMLATTMPSDILLERLEEINESSSIHQLNTEVESIVHSSHYISDHSELLGVSEESIKKTKPEISETESTGTLNRLDHKARNETITEWSDAMVEKLLVPLSYTENLTAAEESGMRKYSQEMNLATTISATEVTVMEHEFLSVSSNISGELYKPNVILSKQDELLLTSFPEPNSEPNFLATLIESPSSKTTTENMVEQYEWEKKGNLSESQLIMETEKQLERETSPKYTLSTETHMMEHEIFSQSSNILEELYTSSAILSEKETLYTQYSTQSNTEENFLATLLEEGNVKVSTQTSLIEESMKYSPEKELSGKTFSNIMVHEISPPSSNTLEDYALTSSLWQKESETEYLTESESEERFLATLLEEGHTKLPTKTTLKEEDIKYSSEEQVTERTITNIMYHEISPTPSSTLKVVYHPITGSSQQNESETEYSTKSESEESFFATLIEEGHAKVSTKTTLKEVDMKYFSEEEARERTITNTLDHEISPTSSSTRNVFYHPITSSTQQKDSETEYLKKSNSEEIMLGTLIENETSTVLTERTTEEYRSEGMKGFSESQLVTEEKGEKKQSPEESIESTIMQNTKTSEDFSSHYSSSSLTTEKEATKTEYLTELSSEEIFLATLVENETTELSMKKTGASLDEKFLTNLEETATVGLYNIISSEKLSAENISETNSEEVFLNTLFEEEIGNISTGNTVFSFETTVKHVKPSISSNILEESFNYSAIATEHEEMQTKNFTKLNSEESFLASLVESEVTKPLPENTSEKYDWHRKDTTSKSPGVEKISGIPLLTTLLLSLVASTTQHPDTNQISGHYKMNTNENQTFPKCLVVFFSGDNASNPMISLNGTEWIPSHGPFVAEETTTSLNDSLSQMSQSTENTSPEAKSVTTELSEDDTSEETETSSSVVVTTEEIIDTSNFIQGGCTEADFENNNNCFCMLDLTIDHVAGEFQASNSSNLNKVECSTFLKVNTGLIIKDEKSSAKRKKRSYLYLKYHNRKKREIVEYNKLDDVLANELVPSNSDGAMYSAVGASVSIPCVYKNEVVEREHFTRYVWTSLEEKVVPLSDRVRETTDGVLKISDVTVKDGENYTCSVNRPFGTTDAEHKRFRHELKIVERPIFKIKTTIMYNTGETCSLKHGDIIHNHLPKLLEELLCGLHKRVCKVEMERPNCVAMEDNTYLSFKYVVGLDALPSLIPSLTYEKCDFDCQMKIYGSLISLLIKNVETINFLNIVSEMKTSNHTFKPREIKFPTDKKTVEDTTLFPMLLIGCPPGFGIQQKTNKICVACPRNYFSADNSSSCVPCPFIHFQPNLGSTGCLECRTPFEDKSCVGMVLANRSFLIIYIGSTVAIIFLILLCVFCAQSVGTPAKKKKNTQTPKRRRMGRRDIEDPAEKTLLLKDTGSRKVVKGPKVPPPDFY